MEFAAFDDDLFVEKNTKKQEVGEYSPRVCTDGWFVSADKKDIVSQEDQLGIQKFTAEYKFLKNEFAAAFKCYQEILELLPPNCTSRRECLEGLCRSCIKLGNSAEALDYAKQLHSTSKTSDQLSVSCSVLLDALLADGQYNEAVRVAQNLVTFHTENSHVWMKLGFTYAKLYSIFLPSVETLMQAHLPGTLSEDGINAQENDSVNRKEETTTQLQSCGEVKTEIGTRALERLSIKDEKNSASINQNEPTDVKEQPDRKVKIVCVCLQKAYTLLKRTENTAVGFAINFSEMNQKKLLADLQKMLNEDGLIEIQSIVALNDKSIQNSSNNSHESESHEFVDRGSSKFKADAEEVDTSLLEHNFEQKWFKWLNGN